MHEYARRQARGGASARQGQIDEEGREHDRRDEALVGSQPDADRHRQEQVGQVLGLLDRCPEADDRQHLNPRYKAFIGAWKHLPLAVSRTLGPRLVRHLG